MKRKTNLGLIKTIPFSAKEKINEEQGKIINEYFEKIDLFLDQLILATGRKIKFPYRKDNGGTLDQSSFLMQYFPRNAQYRDFCTITFKDIEQENSYEVTATLENLSQYYFNGYTIPEEKLIFTVPDEVERLVNTLELFCRHKEEEYPKFDFEKEVAEFFKTES